MLASAGQEGRDTRGNISGAALSAAIQVAVELGKGKKVVFIAPDTGERYLSTDLFNLPQ